MTRAQEQGIGWLGRVTLLCGMLGLLWLALFNLTGPARAQIQGAPQNVRAMVEAETSNPAPGDTVTIAVIMDPKPGWHDYWLNPGDAGTPLELDWTLPDGVTAGPIRAPVPETLVVSGFMNHIYKARHAFLIDLQIAPKLQPGKKLDLKVDARWSACSDLICVPESGSFTIPLTVGNGTIAAQQRTRFDQWRAALPVPLDRQANYAISGSSISIAIPFPESAAADKVWFFPQTQNVFRYAAPQTARRTGNWLILTGGVDKGFNGQIDGLLRFGDGQGIELRALPGSIPSGGETVSVLGAGDTAQGNGNPESFAVILALSILGGLLLNLMPCVFPILGLKAIAIAKAGGDERTARRDALAYTAGILLSCLGLGAIMLGLRAAGQEVGWAFQLQDPFIVFILLLLMVAITANLVGLFELGAVGAGEKLARQEGAAGSFWTGVLAAVVATPCTGPFMAAAIGAALLLPSAQALLIFAGLGLGLALPFLAIAYIPALRARMPRPGPWMVKFRQWMALPMGLTALALLWLLAQLVGGAGWALGAISAAILLIAIVAIKRRQAPVSLLLGVTGVLALAGNLALDRLPRPAAIQSAAAELGGEMFSETKLAQLRDEGKPVFLYFTADWCVTCKVNEAAAINREDTRRAFEQAGIITMVGDYTRRDPAITRFLAKHGRSGVPLYLYYPKQGEAKILPQILTVSDLTELAN